MSSVGDNVDPGGVVRGEGDGHGRHAVLYYRQQLDVREVEVVLVTKSRERRVLRILKAVLSYLYNTILYSSMVSLLL